MNARDVVLALGGQWYDGYGNAPCPSHQGHSLSLTIKDDASQPGGLYVRCFSCCTPREVRAALRAMDLMAGDYGPPSVIDPELKRKRDAEDAERRRVRREYAERLWNDLGSRPATETVHRYLLSRWIDVDRIGGVPPCLRLIPQFRYEGFMKVPAMVSAMTGPDGLHCATHLTFLNQSCTGKIVQDPDKKTYGAPSGGAVRLLPGPVDGALGLSEGIETALSAAELTGLPVWAAATAACMENFIAPAGVRCVVIFADFDKINKAGFRTGTRSAEKLAKRLAAKGIRAEIRYPSGGLKDFNDELVSRKRKGGAA